MYKNVLFLILSTFAVLFTSYETLITRSGLIVFGVIISVSSFVYFTAHTAKIMELAIMGPEYLYSYLNHNQMNWLLDVQTFIFFSEDKLSKKMVKSFRIEIPNRDQISIDETKMNILRLNDRYVSYRFDQFDLVYDQFGKEYILFESYLP